ncbi:uncharacterized protein isoform X2 [Leptinotarsa decemlineata]
MELLKIIISRTIDSQSLRDLIKKRREEILEILTTTTKHRIFNRQHVSDCTTILCDLLSMGGILPMTTSKCIAEITEIFQRLDVIHEIAVITNITLNRFSDSTEAFNVCISWLLRYSPIFLKRELEIITLKELVTAINYFYINYKFGKKMQNSIMEESDKCLDALMEYSDKILIMCKNEVLRKESIKLFSIVLTKYNDQKWKANLHALNELPKDITGWPKVKVRIFLHVCEFLCKTSGLVWHPSEVLQSIANLIYSTDRFQLDSFMLKTICVIYPIVAVECPDKNVVLLGNSLLIILSGRFSELENIFSCHVAQLCWILQYGKNALKKRILCHWLRQGEDIELMKRCVLACKASSVLLRIVEDQHTEENVSDRAIQLINLLQDPALSVTIAMMICVSYTDSKILRRLILSNPGIPEEKDSAMKICEFMSLLLPSIDDETVFAKACTYSKNLLVSLKTDHNILRVFCKDIRNIRFLLLKLKKAKDETGLEILGLLKILVLIQKRNHTFIEEKLVTDLTPCFHGTPSKIEKGLDLLHLVISTDIFIQLSPLKVQAVFLKLLDLYKKQDLTVKCLVCMTEILKRNRWIAFMSCTNLFVEVNCSLEVKECSWREFVEFIRCWMKILNNYSDREAVYEAHTEIVKNYLERALSLSHMVDNRMFKMLKKLEKLNSTNTIGALM